MIDEQLNCKGETLALVLTFIGQYFLFIFLASLGVLQIAASYTHLNGLSFFSRTIWGYIFGTLVVAGGFSWFYAIGNRHPDVSYESTLIDIFRYGWSIFVPQGRAIVMGEGEYVLIFLLAVGCALLITLAISSIVKSGISAGTPEDINGEASEGLEALKGMTFYQAFTRGLRKGKGKE